MQLLNLQLEAKPGCTFVTGKSGSGKTTFALKLLVARSDLACRFIFQEAKRDIAPRLGLADAENEEELDLAIEDGFCIFHPAAMFPGDWPGALEWFCSWSYARAAAMPGRKILMVDEVWKYCSPNSIPKPLAQWILDGRSFGCETLFATQQPNRINETILNEATELVCFRLQGRNAIATMADQGFDPDAIANLPLGAYVALNRETGAEQRGRMWS